jgi:hypothetical protein
VIDLALAIVQASVIDLALATDQALVIVLGSATVPSPAIAPTGSRIAASANNTDKIVVNRFKTSSATIIRAGTFGAITPIGRHGESTRLIAGRRGPR